MTNLASVLASVPPHTCQDKYPEMPYGVTIAVVPPCPCNRCFVEKVLAAILVERTGYYIAESFFDDLVTEARDAGLDVTSPPSEPL